MSRFWRLLAWHPWRLCENAARGAADRPGNRVRSLLEELRSEAAARKDQGLERELRGPSGVDFSSNDYLGLAADTELRKRVLDRLEEGPLTAPSSRLLRGQTERHRQLEERLARFKGTEAALIFPTGYQANLGVLGALARQDDTLLSDRLNHASLIDGMRLTRAKRLIYPHLDTESLEGLLTASAGPGRRFIVTESLFSMDGDIAPLADYADLAGRYGACLMVDDAHATGVFGDARGSGLAEQFSVADRCMAIVSTFGKAFGAFGAFVAGPQEVIDAMVNVARSFIFTTALPPLVLAAIETALDVMEEEPERRVQVRKLADRLRLRLRESGLDVPESDGPIVPVLLPEADVAVGVAAAAQRAGYDVRAIRPPTVPEGSSRVRLSVHADHTEHQIDDVAAVLAGAYADACLLSGSR